eukprot:2977768-Rhodomonas_salina.2
MGTGMFLDSSSCSTSLYHHTLREYRTAHDKRVASRRTHLLPAETATASASESVSVSQHVGGRWVKSISITATAKEGEGDGMSEEE